MISMNFYERRRISGCLFCHFPLICTAVCGLHNFCILPIVFILPLGAVYMSYFIPGWVSGWPDTERKVIPGCPSWQINCVFSNTEFETSVGLLNWTTHYLIPSSLRFNGNSIQKATAFYSTSLFQFHYIAYSFPDSLRFVLKRETWSTIELNGALNWMKHWTEYALNWIRIELNMHWIEWSIELNMHWIEWSIELNMHWIEWNIDYWICIELNEALNWICIELNMYWIELNIALNCLKYALNCL